MDHKFILVVSGEGEGNRGEITVLDSSHDVESMVASLLEAGFDHTRMQVFAGGPADVAITYQPVVHLVDEDSDEREQADGYSQDRTAPAREPVAVGSESDRRIAAPSGGDGGLLVEAKLSPAAQSNVEAVSSSAESPQVEARGHADQPATQGRFSDLFRPAYGWSD